jgi:CIC family chloride channel protein
VILPLMLTCVITVAVSRAIEPDSLYTGVLRRRKVVLPARPRPEWLEATPARELLHRDATTIAPAAPIAEVLLRLLALPPGNDLYVTTPDRRLLGVIVLDALKGHVPESANLAAAIAADVMDRQLRPLGEGATLAEAAKRLAETYLDKLPMVDAEGRLLGTISKMQVVRRGRF